MNYGYPDWMFAAIAIAAWELSAYLHDTWHLTWIRPIAYGVIGICILVLGIRHIVRFMKKSKQQDEPDPDEWKNY